MMILKFGNSDKGAIWSSPSGLLAKKVGFKGGEKIMSYKPEFIDWKFNYLRYLSLLTGFMASPASTYEEVKGGSALNVIVGFLATSDAVELVQDPLKKPMDLQEFCKEVQEYIDQV
jgi:hypothetical protein